jgi:hypothetical protein
LAKEKIIKRDKRKGGKKIEKGRKVKDEEKL